MSNISNFKDDLPPEIRDMEDLILDGYLDEFEALEQVHDENEARMAAIEKLERRQS